MSGGRRGRCRDRVGRGPEVTVIIPTRNRWSLLRRALHTALWQEDVDLEVVVVDDGSTDHTPERLAHIDDPRVRIVRHPQSKGLSAATECRDTGGRLDPGWPSSTTTTSGRRESCAYSSTPLEVTSSSCRAGRFSWTRREACSTSARREGACLTTGAAAVVERRRRPFRGHRSDDPRARGRRIRREPLHARGLGPLATAVIYRRLRRGSRSPRRLHAPRGQHARPKYLRARSAARPHRREASGRDATTLARRGRARARAAHRRRPAPSRSAAGGRQNVSRERSTRPQRVQSHSRACPVGVRRVAAVDREAIS